MEVYGSGEGAAAWGGGAAGGHQLSDGPTLDDVAALKALIAELPDEIVPTIQA